MKSAGKAVESSSSVAVLLFAGADVPRPLAGLPLHRVAATADVDAAVGTCQRLVVVGGDDADLATVLTRLLRADRLDVEVAYVPRRRTAATGVYRLPTGRRAARRVRGRPASRVPLIRDDTGAVIVGRAQWRPAGGDQVIRGEAVVDDTTLFDGEVTGVRIEPTAAVPGLRASVDGRMWRRWVPGRAAQLGTTGATVVREGVAGGRAVRRSTFYRHIEGWLLVR
ncbi:peptidase M50 [Mycobacterium sp. 1423905.2]|uniref:peptidase M50 n=1 Tax=Mycobacterium sp. 1423905.2 TaxID=1856859 RepID=UPI0007FC632F|nr:peptidase M50 [Mycobacterium sp. 1423905.2]OBJ50663.1 peptidase M50 [Mycobacterium sp. 1423905.2]